MPGGTIDVGADLIAPYVPDRVAWLVRMHADAKRYLCAVEPAYCGHPHARLGATTLEPAGRCHDDGGGRRAGPGVPGWWTRCGFVAW